MELASTTVELASTTVELAFSVCGTCPARLRGYSFKRATRGCEKHGGKVEMTELQLLGHGFTGMVSSGGVNASRKGETSGWLDVDVTSEDGGFAEWYEQVYDEILAPGNTRICRSDATDTKGALLCQACSKPLPRDALTSSQKKHLE